MFAALDKVVADPGPEIHGRVVTGMLYVEDRSGFHLSANPSTTCLELTGTTAVVAEGGEPNNVFQWLRV